MKVLTLVGFGACLACRTCASGAGGEDDITAVYSRTSAGYVRARLPNGSFAPESYAVGKGGVWPGSAKDASMDRMDFMDVAHTIAVPLSNQNYVSSDDFASTKLLIMVYWGTTTGAGGASDSAVYQNFQDHQAHNPPQVTPPPTTQQVRAAAAGPKAGGMAAGLPAAMQPDSASGAMATAAAAELQREQADIRTAQLLGYDTALADAVGPEFSAFRLRRDALIAEIEENRYFVVLMAYDFQALLKQKKHRLLWETRFSIRQRRHALDQDLAAMAQFASRYFGQDSHGLIHKPIPLGHVDVGEVTAIGEVPEK
jgi:hypothetical protein